MSLLEKRKFVIFGTAGGVGRKLVEILAAEGATLAVSDYNEEGLAQVEAVPKEKGVQYFCRAADVTDESAVVAFFKGAVERLGALDVLINLPGLSIPAKIWDMEADSYDKTMDVNVKGPFLCSKHFVPLAEGGSHPQIINVGSMASKRANGGAPLYCTAKAAVAMFSEGLALQCQEKGIRVTTMNPGPINSTFWGDRAVPREKFMTTDDFVDVLVFVLKMNPNVVFHDVAFESFAFFCK